MRKRGRRLSVLSLFAFQDIITSVTGIMILVTLVLSLELLYRKENAPPQKTAQILTKLESAIVENQAKIEELRGQARDNETRIGRYAGIDIANLHDDLENLLNLNGMLIDEVSELANEAAAASERVQDARNVMSEHSNDRETIQDLLAEGEQVEQQIEELKRSGRVIFSPSQESDKTPWLAEVTGNEITVARYGEHARFKKYRSSTDFVRFTHDREPTSDYFVLFVKPDGIKLFQEVRQALESHPDKSRRFDVVVYVLTLEQTAIDSQTGVEVP